MKDQYKHIIDNEHPAVLELRAEIERLRAFLEIALEDYECRMGTVNAESLPNHWTVEARAALAGE